MHLLTVDASNCIFSILSSGLCCQPCLCVCVCICVHAHTCTLLHPVLCDPMDYSPLGPSIQGILQARILEWVAIPFSRVSLQPKDWTQVSRIAGRFFTIWAYSLEKTLMLRKIEGKIKRELQRMRWLDSITDSMDVNLRKVQDIVKNRGAWCATVHGVAKSWTQLSDWTTTRKTRWKFIM